MKELDYDRLLEQHVDIVNELSEQAEVLDGKEMTEILRQVGLALGNMGKLKTLKKRMQPEEEEDTTIDDMLTAAREKVAKLNGAKN